MADRLPDDKLALCISLLGIPLFLTSNGLCIANEKWGIDLDYFTHKSRLKNKIKTQKHKNQKKQWQMLTYDCTLKHTFMIHNAHYCVYTVYNWLIH